MFTTTNPTHTANIRATAMVVGAASSVLRPDQCLAAHRAMRAVEEVRLQLLLRGDRRGQQGWLPYVPCIGLPYHGPVPGPHMPGPEACTCQLQHPDDPTPCPWCDQPETGSPAGFYEVRQDVEEEFVELTRGLHLCPKCHHRAVKESVTPGPDPYVFRKCKHGTCDYEEM